MGVHAAAPEGRTDLPQDSEDLYEGGLATAIVDLHELEVDN